MKVGHLAGQGNITAKWALYLMNHKDRLLSSVLIGNNICNVGTTLSFVYLFDALNKSLPVDISRIPSPESWFLTPLLVLFGEMVPKSLFRTYSFELTLKVIPFLMVIYIITFPFTWFFALLTGIFKKNTQPKDYSFLAKAREEMVLIAVEGSKEGTLFESAEIFINNALRLKDRTVADIMKPLLEVTQNTLFTVNQTVGGVKKSLAANDEVIVFDQSKKSPQGIVSVMDIAIAANREVLGRLIKPLRNIDAKTTLVSAIQQIKDGKSGIYAVVEDNRPIGIFNKIDLLRETFGEISADYKQLDN